MENQIQLQLHHFCMINYVIGPGSVTKSKAAQLQMSSNTVGIGKVHEVE